MATSVGRLRRSLRHEVDVDLAAAQHEPRDALRPWPRVRVVDHRAEAAFRELARRRRDGRMAQQALRRQHDERQRIALEQRRLAAQQVEVLRRGRAVDQPQVDVGRRLQEALGPRARVLGPLAFVAVRQQQHQRRLAAPTWRGRR